MESPNGSARATKREWIGLAVIALPCLLYSMDLTVLQLAVPALSAQLRPTSSQLLWIIDVYGFVLAGSLIPMGALGDRIGRRRLLLIGAVAFGLTSIVAAFSVSPRMLIAARAALGLAGATLAPSTLSLIRSMFRDPSQRTVAVGVWISSYSLGGAAGPLIGGVVLEHAAWGSVFLLSLPVMALLLVLGPLLLPEVREAKARPMDLPGALLSLGSVLASIFGIKRWAEDGWSWLVVASICVGACAGIVFALRQRTQSDPLIDLRLLRARPFRAALIAYTVSSFVAFGVFVFLVQDLQLVVGLAPLRAGFWTAPFALAFVIGAQVTPAIARRISPPLVMAMGLVVSAFGFGMLAGVGADSGPRFIVVGMFVYSLGLAPVVTLATDVIIGSAPAERAGAAAALSETGSELGGALGIAILGSIGTAVYRHAIARTLPVGLSDDSANAVRDTLGAALAVAKALPAAPGTMVAQAAREAYASSFGLVCATAAALALGTAIITVLWAKPASDEPVAKAPSGSARSRTGGVERNTDRSVTSFT